MSKISVYVVYKFERALVVTADKDIFFCQMADILNAQLKIWLHFPFAALSKGRFFLIDSAL